MWVPEALKLKQWRNVHYYRSPQIPGDIQTHWSTLHLVAGAKTTHILYNRVEYVLFLHALQDMCSGRTVAATSFNISWFPDCMNNELTSVVSMVIPHQLV